MKQKKISVKHFQNQRLNPISFDKHDIRPVYFRVTYNRKQTELRSACFDHLLNDSEIKTVAQLEEKVRTIDAKLINNVIDNINSSGTFDLQKFKECYEKESINVITFINKEIRNLTEKFLQTYQLKQLLKVVKNTDVDIIYNHFQEIENLLRDRISETNYDQLTTLYNNATNHLFEFKYEIAKYLKLSPEYISAKDWLANSENIQGQIDDVSLNVSTNYITGFTDTQKRNKLISYYTDLVHRINNFVV